MDFFIDTKGSGLADSDAFDDGPSTSSLLDNYLESHKQRKRSSTQTKLGQGKKHQAENLDSYLAVKQPQAIKSKIDQLMKKSVIHTPEFESLHKLPPIFMSDKKLKEQRRKERSKTKGKDWFNLPAPEITDEVKRDLEVLQMRSVLDPKHFYKKNDMKVLPKYFQIGKVMDAPLDYYNNRLTKKQRKHTLVDELLSDMEFKKYNKRKYKEIIEEKRKTDYRAYRKSRKEEKKGKSKSKKK